MKFRMSPMIPALATGLVMAFSIASPGPARAGEPPGYTIEDVTACSADAMRLCRDKMPNIEQIEECMKANYESLRPKCKARFKDR